MKVCITCYELKAAGQFYRTKGSKRRNKCIACFRKNTRLNYFKNKQAPKLPPDEIRLQPYFKNEQKETSTNCLGLVGIL